MIFHHQQKDNFIAHKKNNCYLCPKTKSFAPWKLADKPIVKLAIKFSSKDRNIESYEAVEEKIN